MLAWCSEPGTARVFPNSRSERGDPLSLIVDRSRNTPDDEDGHVSVFLVVSTTPLHSGMYVKLPLTDISNYTIYELICIRFGVSRHR